MAINLVVVAVLFAIQMMSPILLSSLVDKHLAVVSRFIEHFTAMRLRLRNSVQTDSRVHLWHIPMEPLQNLYAWETANIT